MEVSNEDLFVASFRIYQFEANQSRTYEAKTTPE